MSDKVLRIVVVDDEAPARQLLREYLAELAASGLANEVVAECGNGFEAVKAVSEQAPDVLLLDIQMPKLDGFEVVDLLADERPAIIFVTAFDEYAIKAFEVHAVDYLLKPFTVERLAEALAHLPEAPPLPVPELVREARGTGEWLERILVREGARIHVVPVEQLDYVEAQDDHVLLEVRASTPSEPGARGSRSSKGSKTLRKQQTLSQLASQLDGRRFVRIHRSYILNLDRLAKIELYAKDSRVAILSDGRRLPISRSGYGRLRQLL